MLKEHGFDTKIIAIPYGNYSDDTKKIVTAVINFVILFYWK